MGRLAFAAQRSFLNTVGWVGSGDQRLLVDEATRLGYAVGEEDAYFPLTLDSPASVLAMSVVLKNHVAVSVTRVHNVVWTLLDIKKSIEDPKSIAKKSKEICL